MMKPDDRDIVCEQDYTPLSNAELVAHIERYAGLMHSTPLSDGEWLDDIIGPARVLLARAEAAEALAAERLEDALFAEQRATDAELERDGAILAASDAERHAENAMHGLAHFRARVAELEAQLAAQQWRPVTEDWPHYHDRVVIAHWGGTWAQFARRVQSDDGEDEWLLDDGRKFDFESASVALLTSPPPLPH